MDIWVYAHVHARACTHTHFLLLFTIRNPKNKSVPHRGKVLHYDVHKHWFSLFFLFCSSTNASGEIMYGKFKLTPQF